MIKKGEATGKTDKRMAPKMEIGIDRKIQSGMERFI